MKVQRLLSIIAIWSCLSAVAFAQHYYNFPHFVSGGGWASDIFLTNQGSQSVSDVQVSFFDDSGAPRAVSTTIGTGSVFTLTLAAGETRIIQTASAGATITGYVLVRFPSSGSIRGSEIFRYTEANVTITQVGVPMQSPFQHYSFPVEIKSSSAVNTGVALANLVFGADQNRRQDTVIDLIRSDGSLQQSTVVALGAGQHVAKFLDQLFPGVDNFSGTLSISGPNPIGVLGLKQNGSVYASVSVSYGPILGPFIQGGTPTSETEPNNDKSQANALTKSGIVSGIISSTSDVDYFSFTAKRDDIVSFLLDTQSISSYLDSIIRLEKADGTVLAENDQNGLLEQNDSFLQAVIPEDGTYYIRIVDYWGDGGSAYTYRLHLTLPAHQTQPLPQITTLNPSGGKQGETMALTIAGTNLSGATAVKFSPNTGITVSGIQSTSTQVTCSVLISSSATTGSRTVTITNAGGTSNSLAFTVSAGTPAAPSISSISPSAGSQGATVSITIAGTNLSGATAVNFNPSSGITVSSIQATATQVTCSVAISSSAETGSRSVSVTTAGGTSGTLSFTVAVPGDIVPDSGSWSGRTSESLSIRFSVSGMTISNLVVGLLLSTNNGPLESYSCRGVSTATVSSGKFTVDVGCIWIGDIPVVTVPVKGTFTSSAAANGTVSSSATWQATKQ